MVSLADAKKSPVEKTGVVGTVLAEKSAHGKPLAQFTCSVPGCVEVHVREVSDWHQCSKCKTHSGKRTRAKKVAPVNVEAAKDTMAQCELDLAAAQLANLPKSE
jgi:hypothetical protein